jgi:hypothetical protein
MTHQGDVAGHVADRPLSERQPRCLCCDGIISNCSEAEVGLNLKLGLVSDECALICNDCTTRLIEARALLDDPSRKHR